MKVSLHPHDSNFNSFSKNVQKHQPIACSRLATSDSDTVHRPEFTFSQRLADYSTGL